jgi:multidrug efflux pump subunit AcrB
MVKKVDIYGKQAKKVYIEFSHQRLRARHHAGGDRGKSAQSGTGMLPGIDRYARRSRARARERPVRERRRHPQRSDHAGGRTIKLGDFTTITRGFEDPPDVHACATTEPVLMLGVVDDGRRQHRRTR